MIEETRCPVTNWVVRDCLPDTSERGPADIDDPDSAYDSWRERDWCLG